MKHSDRSSKGVSTVIAMGCLLVLFVMASGSMAWAAPGAQGTAEGLPPPPPPPPPVVIPVTGETTAKSSAGDVSVFLPNGCLPGGGKMTLGSVRLTDLPPANSGGFRLSNHAISLALTDSNGNPVRSFGCQVAISFTLTDAEIAAAGGSNAVTFQWYDPATGTWVGLQTISGPGPNQFTTYVTHFSLFAVFAQAKDSTTSVANTVNWSAGLPWGISLALVLGLGVLWAQRSRRQS